MNRVAMNLLLLLILDPRWPTLLGRILHHALHTIAVLHQNIGVRPPWSNAKALGWETLTGGFPEEEGTSCTSSSGQIRPNLELVAHLVQLLQNLNAK